MSELTKCNNGLTDKLFGISCPITLSDDLVKGLNTECNNGDLAKVMNPYLSNTKACRNHQTHGRDTDLGYLSYYADNNYILTLRACWKLICRDDNRGATEIDLRNF